jgi:hypothetical protein
MRIVATPRRTGQRNRHGILNFEKGCIVTSKVQTQSASRQGLLAAMLMHRCQTT